jgi:hypothetical protein
MMKRNLFAYCLSVWLTFLIVLAAHAGGKLLGSNVQVTDNGLGQLGEAQHADAASASVSITYAVWEDNRDEPADAVFHAIYLAKSTDGGASWGANVHVSDPDWEGLGLADPSVAVGPEGNVYVVWYLGNCYYSWSDPAVCGGSDHENDVFIARSTDGGTSFEPPVWLWDGGDDGVFNNIAPALDVDSSNGYVYALVHDFVTSGYDIYAMGSNNKTESGSWWQVKINDQAKSGRNAGTAGPLIDVAACDGVVCAAWEDSRGSDAIYGACSSNQGHTFGTNFAVSGANATQPRLAFAPDGSLYAAYKAGGEVYLRRSTNRGVSWSSRVQVSSVPSGDELGRWDLAVDGNGTVAVLWAEGVWDTFGGSRLYLSTSIDAGQTFTRIRVDDANGTFFQYSPAIAAIGSGDYARAVMIWTDDRNTQDQIWSARAELDGTPPTAPTDLRATPGDTVVDITWDAASDRNGISAYYVVRSAQSGGTYSVLNPLPVTGTSYRDVGLDGGTYYYKVYAVDGTGNFGPASNEVSAAATVGTDLPLNGTIAYESSGDVRLRDLPSLGNERTLGQGWAPIFGPNGQRVYYRSGQTVGGSVVSRKIDGSDLQTYFSNDKLYGAFDIARDDTRYFTWIQEQQYSQINPFEIWETYEPHYGISGSSLYVDNHEFAESPTISAGRQWLAYTSAGNHAAHVPAQQYDHVALCLADLNSKTRVGLYQETNYQDPAFAPSGSVLAFAADFSGQYEIWKATVGISGTLSGLTQLTRGESGVWSRAPAWSSDGNWLIFQRDINASPTITDTRLFVVRADGPSLRNLGIAGQEPAWHGGGSEGAQDKRTYLPLLQKGTG